MDYKKSIYERQLDGFTLIEVLVVVGIIALLSTLGMAALNYAREKARVTAAESEIDTLYKAIGDLMVDTGEWPGHQTPESVNSGTGNELWDLSVPAAGLVTTDGLYDNWRGPYLPEIPKDPWGNNYFLDTDYDVGSGVMKPVVGSFGPNGVGPNLYDNDDIYKVIY